MGIKALHSCLWGIRETIEQECRQLTNGMASRRKRGQSMTRARWGISLRRDCVETPFFPALYAGYSRQLFRPFLNFASQSILPVSPRKVQWYWPSTSVEEKQASISIVKASCSIQSQHESVHRVTPLARIA